MPAYDANNATFYVIRYPEDFAPVRGAVNDETAPFGQPSSPYLQPTLLYDERRGVLELQPEASDFAADPPPGMAIDLNGDVYRVGDDGVLYIVRCDGSEAPLFCEPNILAQPAGMAFDRRGFLYIADPAAHRVVVFDPGNRVVVAILGGGGPVGVLVEPIDVAVAPSGFVFVADRGAGRIAVFSGAMQPLASFNTEAAPGKTAQPIVVIVDAAGNVLVADAWLPRLLNYEPDGTRLADVDLSTLVAPLAGGDIAMGAFGRAYGCPPPRLLLGTCGPCATPEDDGPARLAEVHRALRLLSLTLGRRFEPSGIFISRALDSGRPGVEWHRVSVELNGAPPPDTSVTVETFTSDSATPGTPVWDAPRHKTGAAISFTQLVPEQLVQSPRGRFLWVRVTLSTSDGHNTPSVSAIRAWYPRVSYLDLLPAAYRRDPEAAIFLDHFLALFEHVFTGIEDRYVAFSSELDCESAPREVIDWLGALVDLAFDPSWPLEKRQALVCEAISLYRTRGTIPGIERYVEIYIGNRPQIVEDWLERPSRPAFLGMPGAVLGWGLPILPVVGGAMPSDAVLWALYAHRFTIFVYIDDDGQTEMTLRAVDRIVEVNKPAHTVHRSEPIFANARVGIQSRVGLDLVLGAPPAMSVQLGGCEPNSAGINEPGGVLGRNTLLGSARAGYVQPLGAPGTGAQ